MADPIDTAGIRARLAAARPWKPSERVCTNTREDVAVMAHAYEDLTALLALLDAERLARQTVERERDEARAMAPRWVLHRYDDTSAACYPHRFASTARKSGQGGSVCCRCGATSGWLSPNEPAPETWDSDCPAALREEIADLRAPERALARAMGRPSGRSVCHELIRDVADTYIQHAVLIDDARQRRPLREEDAIAALLPPYWSLEIAPDGTRELVAYPEAAGATERRVAVSGRTAGDVVSGLTGMVSHAWALIDQHGALVAERDRLRDALRDQRANITATIRARAAQRRATADAMEDHADAARYYTYAVAEECCAVLVERGTDEPEAADLAAKEPK